MWKPISNRMLTHTLSAMAEVEANPCLYSHVVRRNAGSLVAVLNKSVENSAVCRSYSPRMCGRRKKKDRIGVYPAVWTSDFDISPLQLWDHLWYSSTLSHLIYAGHKLSKRFSPPVFVYWVEARRTTDTTHAPPYVSLAHLLLGQPPGTNWELGWVALLQMHHVPSSLRTKQVTMTCMIADHGVKWWWFCCLLALTMSPASSTDIFKMIAPAVVDQYEVVGFI